jgi:hypothetical protein
VTVAGSVRVQRQQRRAERGHLSVAHDSERRESGEDEDEDCGGKGVVNVCNALRCVVGERWR